MAKEEIILGKVQHEGIDYAVLIVKPGTMTADDIVKWLKEKLELQEDLALN